MNGKAIVAPFIHNIMIVQFIRNTVIGKHQSDPPMDFGREVSLRVISCFGQINWMRPNF